MVKLLVIIDMGHGGSDPGASANGVVEKTANYNTGIALGDYLKSKGVKVLYTRTGDNTMSLKARTDLANKYARENHGYTCVFISVHHNAGGGDRGEYIHSLFSNAGQNLAKAIANEMTNRLSQQQKVYSKKGSSSNKDYYHVIRETSMPAIIVEVAFLDNKLDVQICDTVDEQKRNGRVIADGILKHYGLYTSSNPTPKPPTSSSEMYRVRKTWADAASQKGAYSDKNNAIVECKKHSGYKVFDSKGKEIYSNSVIKPSKPSTSSNSDKEIKRYTEHGTCKVAANILNVRNKPSTSGEVVAKYYKNETVKYDLVVLTEKYVWISWIGASSGTRRYMAVKDKTTNVRWGNCY